MTVDMTVLDMEDVALFAINGTTDPRWERPNLPGQWQAHLCFKEFMDRTEQEDQRRVRLYL
jgi:hypothetical protein